MRKKNTQNRKKKVRLNKHYKKKKIRLNKRSAEVPLNKDNAFSGFTFHRALKGGKQKKALYTGFYKKLNELFVFKKSEDFPADNIAEVVTSSLLTDFIDEKNVIPYEFQKNQLDNSFYLRCPVKKDFDTIGSLLKNKKGFLHQWVGANPTTSQNKKYIQDCFDDKEISRGGDPAVLKKDMANILAGCLLLNDVDCQVENIALYTDIDGRRRAAKFDDGWGLANFCDPDNAKVDLFGSLKFYGNSGTHEKTTLPTNHFIDYPFILHSIEFADSLKQVAHKAQFETALPRVNSALKKIDETFTDMKERRQAYLDFANHLKVSLPQAEFENLEPEDIREMIHIQISKQLELRSESMLILSIALKIKIKIDEGSYNVGSSEAIAIEKALSTLLKKVQNRAPEDLLPNFEEANDPFKQTKEAKEKLHQVFNRVLAFAYNVDGAPKPKSGKSLK